MTEEKRKFYVGVRPECGCHTAMLVDDEQTSPKEIARFARDMAKTKRVVRHVELTREEYMATFRPCPHKPPNACYAPAEVHNTGKSPQTGTDAAHYGPAVVRNAGDARFAGSQGGR